MEQVYISLISVRGTLWKICGTERGITQIYPTDASPIPCENPMTAWAAKELEEYLTGKRKTFTFPLALRGTAFQLAVWNVLREIPFGKTVSYIQIAKSIGKPKAVRAVGQAIGRNPCLIAVPCHRVVGKNGALTGFSAGLPWKRYLLELEASQTAFDT